MKRILVIQSRNNLETIVSEQDGYRRAVGEHGVVNFISSLDDSLPWNLPERIIESYDAVILGGSGDYDFDGGREHDDVARIISNQIVERIQNLIQYVIDRDFPFLAICFGHQIVSEVLGVKVIHDHSQKKAGSYHVTLTGEGRKDTLFSHLPETFFAQYMHKDSLSDCPNGATLLASSDCCRASALRFGTRVYTLQFHPELTAEDLAWKLEDIPGYLHESIDPRSVVKPSPEASTIIPRFLASIVD